MGGAWFSKPWRTLPDESDYEYHLNCVKGYKPRSKSVKHVRILLHGPVGSGKSTFINSVNNLFQKRITSPAFTDGLKGGSFTQKYKTHKIWKNHKESYNFVFNDIKGLEEQPETDSEIEDIKRVLKGRVRDGYKFSSESHISEEDEFYNAKPTLNDKVHVLVFVIPADTLPVMSKTLENKMRNIRLTASEEGIPQIAIITKIDECCPKVKDDMAYAHKSQRLERQVNKASQILGIPPNCIFLVQNYCREMAPNPSMNALILFALKQMVEFGEDYLNSQEDEDSEEEE